MSPAACLMMSLPTIHFSTKTVRLFFPGLWRCGGHSFYDSPAKINHKKRGQVFKKAQHNHDVTEGQGNDNESVRVNQQSSQTLSFGTQLCKGLDN